MNWIESFLAHTDGIPSPQIFRLWAGITAVAGALERRVWVKTRKGFVFPNIYTLLVAPPAVGKSQAIDPVIDLWYNATKFKVAANSLTKASLVDALAGASKKMLMGENKLVEYHTLLVPAPELGVLVPAHDLEFLSVLNYIYDNPRVYREERRTGNKVIEIIHPQMTILAGTQPGFLSTLLPETAWSMGYMSRQMMIYAEETPSVDIFGDDEETAQDERSFKALVKGLQEIGSLFGPAQWTPEAMAGIRKWKADGEHPVPEHAKLVHYKGRRLLYALKLSLISAASMGNTLITEENFNQALGWLLNAEKIMPDVFRAIKMKSDNDVLQELHMEMWKQHKVSGKSIHSQRIWSFLSTRIPADRIYRVVETAINANIISREAGTTDYYLPNPKVEWGIE